MEPGMIRMRKFRANQAYVFSSWPLLSTKTRGPSGTKSAIFHNVGAPSLFSKKILYLSIYI